MKKLGLICCLGTLMCSAVATDAVPTLGDMIEQLAQKNEAITQQLDQIWPQHGMEDVTFIFVNPAEAFSVQGKAWKRLTGEEKDQIAKAVNIHSDLSFDYDPSQKALAVVIEPTKELSKEQQVNRALSLTYHELFHFLTQKPSWMSGLEMGRVTPSYPSDPVPRAYRNAIREKLIQALGTPDAQLKNQALDAAAGFYQEWKRLYPDEYSASQYTDILEGTARYFEERVLQVMSPDHKRELSRKYADIDLEVDRESYALGALAGLLLDQTDKDRKWIGQVKQAKTPLELLLSQRQAAPLQPDAQMVESVRSALAEYEQYISPYLDPSIRAITQNKPLLRIDATNTGSSTSIGSYRLSQFPDMKLKLMMDIQFNLQDGLLIVKDVVMIDSERPNLAGQYFIIEPNWIKNENGKMTLESPNFSRPLVVEPVVEGNQLIYQTK